MLEISGLAYLLLVFIIAWAGRSRKCGFGWPFLLGVIFTPLISLVLVLLSDRLPSGETKWGCFWPVIIMIILSIIAIPLMILFGAGIIAAITALAGSAGAMMSI